MEEKKSLDILHKILTVLTAVFSILILLPPIIGFSFNIGYLSVFGLDNEAFPRSTIELWQYSFLVFLKWLAMLVKPYGLIMIFYAGMFVLLLLLLLALMTWKLFKSPSSEKKSEPSRKNSALARMDIVSSSIDAFFNESRSFWIGLFTVMGLPILIYFLLIHPSYLGKEMAQNSFDHYKQFSCVKTTSSNWESCFNYLNPNDIRAKSYSGLLVAASNTHIAFFDGQKVSVIPKVPEYVLTRQLMLNTDHELELGSPK